METLKFINGLIAILFFICYSYQFFYILVPFFKKDRPHGPAGRNRFAVLISARNEEKVIGNLIESLRSQTYDAQLVTVFVVADNCTDDTARVAEEAGAVVFRRFNTEQVGKGYALNFLLSRIEHEGYGPFDAYLVFDADNVLDKNYISEMNKTFSDGYEVITSYRNSKNYGDNWISAGYGLWFLRESRYLNHSRMLLGTSCAVSGTGFLFSRRVIEACGGWNFFLLTEDIQFTVHQVTGGCKIGYCPGAVLFDEQPVTFRQSWDQRLRWARGYLQVFGRYGLRLFRGVMRGSYGCYDMSMTIMPAAMLSFLMVAVNGAALLVGLLTGGDVQEALGYFTSMLGGTYVTMFAIGLITTITEWRNIYTSTAKKLLFTLTFPLFMMTYIPIAITAIFRKDVGWKPIEHTVSATVEDIKAEAFAKVG